MNRLVEISCLLVFLFPASLAGSQAEEEGADAYFFDQPQSTGQPATAALLAFLFPGGSRCKEMIQRYGMTYHITPEALRNSDYVSIGLIGAGKIAQDRHIPLLQKVPRVEVTHAWSHTTDRARKAAQQFNIPNVVDRWERIVEAQEIDAGSRWISCVL